MKKYTFLAKNPRFCMQDRIITIADTAKTNTETNTNTKNLKLNGNEHDSRKTSQSQTDTVGDQLNMALCPVQQQNTTVHHYNQFKHGL